MYHSTQHSYNITHYNQIKFTHTPEPGAGEFVATGFYHLLSGSNASILASFSGFTEYMTKIIQNYYIKALQKLLKEHLVVLLKHNIMLFKDIL